MKTIAVAGTGYVNVAGVGQARDPFVRQVGRVNGAPVKIGGDKQGWAADPGNDLFTLGRIDAIVAKWFDSVL